jgi:hypothetical protein
MAHEFGNINLWTQDKLIKVREYLDAYLVALKNKNFGLEYIDALLERATYLGRLPYRILYLIKKNLLV